MAKIIDTNRSSLLNSVSYENGTMLVEFKNGGAYEYQGVPETLFDEMSRITESDSFGKFFIKNIRTSFPFTKIRGAAKVHA